MAISAYTSDKIKIIGLILTVAVVFHHAHNLQFADAPAAGWVRYSESFFHYGLRGLSVPFFFIASGYFLCARAGFLAAWPKEVGKRVGSLLVPFLIWSAGWLLVMWMLQKIPSLSPYFGRDHIVLADVPHVLDLMTFDPIPHPLWYMRDLFLLTLLSPLVVAAMKRNWSMVLYFAGAAALYYSVPSIELREAQDLLFFGAGVALAVRQPTIPAVPKPLRWGMLGVALALMAYHCWWVDTRFQESQWIMNTAVLIGLPALWLVYDDLAGWLRGPTLLAMADYALFIYMGHEPLLTITRKILIEVAGNGSAALFAIWLGTGTAMIVGLAIVAWVMRVYVPRLYALLVGGRVAPARAPWSAGVAPAPGNSSDIPRFEVPA